MDQLLKGANCSVTFANGHVIIREQTQSVSTNKKVTGVVKDANGEPVIGANVVEKGTINGNITDIDGRFQLEVSHDAVLIVSYIGYIAQEVAVRNRQSISVTLSENTQSLEEVVVIGYGTVKKKDLTGAVAVVNTKTMGEIPTASVLESMNGLVPGIEISMNARPGDTGFATIRGISNFTNNAPLYVIDGLPTDNIRDLNSNDIESMQVLKDASAASIYGSRAANGVIVITSKQGTAGSVKVSASASYAIQHYAKPFKLAGAEEWSRLNDVALQNAGLPTMQHDLSIDTDWWGAAVGTGEIQQYNLSLSGGNEVGNYYVSGEYYKNDGVLYSSSYERFSVRVNTSAKRGIFGMGQTLTLSNNKVDPTAASTIMDVLSMAPVVPVYDTNNPGGYGYGDPRTNNNIGNNPIAQEDLQIQENMNFRIRGSIWGEAAILKSLKYKLNVGYELNFINNKTLRKEGNWRMNMAYQPSYVNENAGRFDRPLIENTLTFDEKFGKHAVTAMAGNSYQKETYRQIAGEMQNILQTSEGKYFDVLDAGTNMPKATGYRNIGVLLSYLGRVSYIYDDKYLLTGTIRRDASSRVKKENRWGNFPSISAAWRISQENFLANITWLDDLKLRVSYGTLGSLNIGYWNYVPVINTFLTATFGTDQSQQSAATQTNLVNENLVWESQTQLNFGFDATALSNRLYFSADYYISKTDDVLTAIPILLTTGNGAGNPVVNAASLENRGFEFSLGWRDQIKDFTYYANLNLSTVRNKVTNLGYGRVEIINGQGRTAIGRPIGEFFLIKTEGLFQSEEEIQAYKNTQGIVIQPDAKPGDIKYIDYNGDGKITEADRQLLGSPHSAFQAGINLGGAWRNFDIKMNWFMDIGSEVFNATKQYMIGADLHSNGNSQFLKGFNYWTPEKPTNIPRPIAGKINNRRDSDYWLENGSWLKLKTLSIGYSMPREILSKINFSSCRVYTTLQNVFTITSFSMQDPEYRKDNIWNKGHRGISAYPNPFAVNFGIQVQF
jgi:TonB-linked SusC/RagA family outer membrane protein